MSRSKIGKVIIKEILSKLDYDLNSVADRINLVNDILYENETLREEFQEIMDDPDDRPTMFNVCICKDEALNTFHPLSKLIEKLTDYILFAPDARHKEVTTYKFYNKSAFYKKLLKEKSIEAIQEKLERNQENVIYYLKDDCQNYKLEKKVKICKSDFQDSELTPIHELEQFKHHLQERLEHLKATNGNKTEIYRLSNIIAEIKKEQIEIKTAIKRPISFKSPMESKGYANISQYFSFDDLNQIKQLLRMAGRGLNSSIGVLSIDIQHYLKYAGLSKDERRLLDMWCYEDATQEMISILMFGEEFDITIDHYNYLNALKSDIKQEIIKKSNNLKESSKIGNEEMLLYMKDEDIVLLSRLNALYSKYQPEVSKRLNRIASKIKKVYDSEKYDWIHLNYVRGKYQKCVKCGEVKLLKYFDKQHTVVSGYRSTCKKCRKISNN